VIAMILTTAATSSPCPVGSLDGSVENNADVQNAMPCSWYHSHNVEVQLQGRSDRSQSLKYAVGPSSTE
jgi:hypothetical protein